MSSGWGSLQVVRRWQLESHFFHYVPLRALPRPIQEQSLPFFIIRFHVPSPGTPHLRSADALHHVNKPMMRGVTIFQRKIRRGQPMARWSFTAMLEAEPVSMNSGVHINPPVMAAIALTRSPGPLGLHTTNTEATVRPHVVLS